MKVHLVTDGRDFDGEEAAYKPGDVAWFEEDILLVTRVEGDTAYAIVHPAAQEMMHAALHTGHAAAEGIDTPKEQAEALGVSIEAIYKARSRLNALIETVKADLEGK